MKVSNEWFLLRILIFNFFFFLLEIEFKNETFSSKSLKEQEVKLKKVCHFFDFQQNALQTLGSGCWIVAKTPERHQRIEQLVVKQYFVECQTFGRQKTIYFANAGSFPVRLCLTRLLRHLVCLVFLAIGHVSQSAGKNSKRRRIGGCRRWCGWFCTFAIVSLVVFIGFLGRRVWQRHRRRIEFHFFEKFSIDARQVANQFWKHPPGWQ